MALERILIRLAPGETVQPGEYTVRDGAAVSRRPATDCYCPYCEGLLVEFDTPGALRVAQVDEPAASGAQPVKVFPMPDGQRLLKCNGCAQFFTTHADCPMETT